MNYTLHQLQIFLEVVQQKSITRAAEEMHMTQPALSIQLKNFQSQFDIPLTEVIGRQLYITEFGYSIAELAQNVIRESETIHYRTKEYEGLFSGKLKISSASTGKYVIPFFLSDFMAKHPGIDIVLDVTNKTTVIQSLKNNEIDFALVSVIPEDVNIVEEILLENRLYLVGNTPKHDLNRPFIFREMGSATRMVMDAFLSQKQERKRIELTSNEAVKQAVVAGMGYSILPLIGIKNELESGHLSIIPTKGLPISTQWRLIWLKSKKLSPVAQAYLEYIRAEKQKVINDHFAWFMNYK